MITSSVRSPRWLRIALLGGLMLGAATAPASTLSTNLLYNFTGSISGGTYTESGGIPTTATVHNIPTVAGGLYSQTKPSGAGLTATLGSSFNMANTSFVFEALIQPGLPAGQMGTGNGANEAVIGIDHGTYWELSLNGNNLFAMAYSGGGPKPSQTVTTPDILDRTKTNHVAMVHYANYLVSGQYRLDLWVNGALKTNLVYSNTGGFGTISSVDLFNLDLSGTWNRPYAGTSDAVALWTFSGNTFDRFLLVPEPSQLFLLFTGGGLLMYWRRRLRR